MNQDMPTMGVRAVFDDSQVATGVKRFNTRMAQAEKSTNAFAKSATSAGSQVDRAFKVADAAANRHARVMDNWQRRISGDYDKATQSAEKYAQAQAAQEQAARTRAALTGATPGGLGARIAAGAPSADDARAGRIAARSRDAAEAVRELTDAEDEGNKPKEKSVSLMAQQMKALRRFRWGLVSMIFFARMLSKVVVASFRQIGESIETAAGTRGVQALASSYGTSLASVTESLKGVSDGTITTRQAVSVAQQGMLADQGRFASEYSKLWDAARVASVTAGVDAEQAFGGMVQAVAEGSGTILDSVTPIYNAEAALQRYATQSNRTVEALTEQERQQVILQTIYQRTNELVASGADEALNMLAPLQRLNKSWEELTDTMGRIAAVTPALEFISDMLDTIAKSTIITVAGLVTTYEATEHLYELLSKGNVIQFYKDAFTAGDYYNQMMDRQRELFQQISGALVVYEGEVSNATDAVNDFGDAQVDARTKMADLIGSGLERAAQAIAKYKQRVERAERDYARQLDKFYRRFQTDLSRIDRRAETARNRAIRNFDKARERQQQQSQDRIAEMTERFNLQQRQKAERHTISMLQSSRMYQYERGLLVAKGDVLAIDDLDARYELEQEAQAENFEQQKRQAEELFELQLKYAKKAAEEQANALAKSLAEQLAEIELRRQEERAERAKRHDETLADAAESYQDQLDELEASLEDQLEIIGRNIQDQVEEWRAGYGIVIDIIEQAFGPGGDADSILDGFFARHADVTERMQQWITTGTYGSPAQPLGRPGARQPGRPNRPPPHPFYMQHGGSGIVTQPTTFVAGEAGAEHYSFTPMPGGAGGPGSFADNMSVSWQGGAIPVHGTGQFDGADMGAVGSAIAQGLMIELTAQVQDYRGKRGR